MSWADSTILVRVKYLYMYTGMYFYWLGIIKNVVVQGDFISELSYVIMFFRFFKGYGRIREILLKNGYGFVKFKWFSLCFAGSLRVMDVSERSF